jgi:ankyrin repeat protein
MAKMSPETAALFAAIPKKQAAAIEAALAAGADLSARKTVKEYPKVTPLHLAVVAGDADIVARLLKAGARGDARDEDDATPLHYAAGHLGKPSLPILTLLLDAGADVNARTAGAFTPLHSAVEARRSDLVEVLLARGADLHAVSGRGTPLAASAISEDPAIFELLLARGADWRMNESVDMDGHITSDWTLLHAATQMGATKTVARLLALGADPDAASEQIRYGKPVMITPRSLAAESELEGEEELPALFR